LETFELHADCLGSPISGYYARPLGAKPKSCAALLYVEGAGVQSADLLAPSRWAQKGLIALDINAHGIPNGKAKDFYTALANGELKDYRTHGRESRDTYYFLGVYLRVIRGLDFLATQPEWDGHTLIIEGVSQGGAQAIAGAALDPRVTFLLAGFPAMCDHTGMLAGRIAGWPKLVPLGADGKPDPAILQTSRYFDSVNFATRVKAPSYFWIGFVDSVTPPTSSYAAYNNVPGNKQIMNDPPHGHGRDNPQLWSTISDVILAQVAKQASPQVAGGK
jgi:cephalosporin-C deacetylase-like acetyl esterase